MTKEELEHLVREIYGMYNKDLYDTDRPHIMRGWWTHFEHENIDEVRTTVQHVTVVERYMPSAGYLKLEHLRRTCDDPPPTPQEFWALIQQLTQNLKSGTTHLPQKPPTKTAHQNPPQKNPTKTPEKNNPPKSGPTKTPHLQHPATQATIKELGQALYTLTTNQDRQFALDAYNKHCLNWLQGQNS